jgi:hypothetical protein
MIKYRVIHNPVAARNCGFSKNHLLIEVFAVGGWRPMGFYTLRDLGSDKWQADALRRLKTNGGVPLSLTTSSVVFCKVD